MLGGLNRLNADEWYKWLQRQIWGNSQNLEMEHVKAVNRYGR